MSYVFRDRLLALAGALLALGAGPAVAADLAALSVRDLGLEPRIE